MRTIHLIRHAQTDLAGRFCGQSDPPLNAAGHAQLPALLDRLADSPLAAIYTSHLRRARETGDALAAPRGLTCLPAPGLAEIDFGTWEALTWEEIEQRDPAYSTRWVTEFPALPTPGGEPIGTFKTRVLNSLAEVLAASSGDLAIVTHAGCLRVVLESLGHYPAHHAWERTREYTCIIRCTQARPNVALEVAG